MLLFPRTPLLKSIQSERQMRVILRQECARGERDGREFSVVMFKWRVLQNQQRKNVEQLLRLLKARFRRTDTLGWLDGNIAVIMPATPFQVAQMVTSGILEAGNETLSQCNFEVFTYPAGADTVLAKQLRTSSL